MGEIRTLRHPKRSDTLSEHMKRSVLFTLVGFSVVGALTVGACSDNPADNIVCDTSVPDTNEASTDTTPDTNETGSETSTETGTDAQPDTSDADTSSEVFIPDANVVDAPQPQNFINSLILGFCVRRETCCRAGGSVGTFKSALCDSYVRGTADFGVLGIPSLYPPAVSGGSNVNYNPAQADICLRNMALLPCGSTPSASWIALVESCKDVFSGKVATNFACLTDGECAAGNWCDGGICKAFKAKGAKCTVDPLVGPKHRECGFGPTGIPNYCSPETEECDSPQRALSAACNTNQECLSQVCDTDLTATCIASYPFSTATTCQDYF